MNVEAVEIRAGPMTFGEYRLMSMASAESAYLIVLGRTVLTGEQFDALDLDDALKLYARVVNAIQREVNLQMFGNALGDVLTRVGEEDGRDAPESCSAP